MTRKIPADWKSANVTALIHKKGNSNLKTTEKLYDSNWEDNFKVGDILLINSPVKTSVLWPLGRVIKLLTSSGECVRAKRSDSSKGVHSINLLYPLELSITSGFDDIVELPIEETTTKLTRK